MTTFNPKGFKPNNDSQLAKYLGVIPLTVYTWKKNNPKKYELVKLGWIAKCNQNKD